MYGGRPSVSTSSLCMVCAGFASPPAAWLSDETIEWWPAYREESSAAPSRPAAAAVVVVVVESFVVALPGFVFAELEKPARGNWEEVERPSDICKERPIETEGLSMRKGKKSVAEKKRQERVRRKKQQPARQKARL